MHCIRHVLIGLFGHCPEAKLVHRVESTDLTGLTVGSRAQGLPGQYCTFVSYHKAYNFKTRRPRTGVQEGLATLKLSLPKLKFKLFIRNFHFRGEGSSVGKGGGINHSCQISSPNCPGQVLI